MNRRRFLGASALSLLAGTTAACAGKPEGQSPPADGPAPDAPAPGTPKANAPMLSPTPPEIEGPFYPVQMQKDRDFDLTRVEGRTEAAKGDVVWIEGRVVDQHGTPVEDALVDLWQANAAGRYRHPNDPSDTPLDPNFQGWAIVRSGKDGGFRFKTIVPGVYAAAPGWDRPPHIHFKVSKRGFVELTTQMYFPGNKLNDIDKLILRHAPEDRGAMIAQRGTPSEGVETLSWQVVLERV